jgi:alkanesulfonate monooxygenase SsuD/methylene tetrahydromethanopterin reductase-like flavin-dependent oxidoreductase (luciferase family)
VSTTIDTLRAVWTGTAGGVRGYLPPEPVPPVIVGGFGPRMAELAGRQADGINCPPSLLDQLLPVARRARDDAGLDPDDFLVTTSAVPSPTDLHRLTERGVDRAIVMIRPPYCEAVDALAARLDPSG